MEKREYSIRSYSVPEVIGQSSADYEFVILAETKVDAMEVVSQVINDRQNGKVPANLEEMNTNSDHKMYMDEKRLVSVKLLKSHAVVG